MALLPATIGTKKALGAAGVLGGGGYLGGLLSGSDGDDEREQDLDQDVGDQITKKETTTRTDIHAPQITHSPQRQFDKTFSPTIMMDSPEAEGGATTKKQQQAQQEVSPDQNLEPRQRVPVTTQPTQVPRQEPMQEGQGTDMQTLIITGGLITGGTLIALEVLG